MRSFIVWTKGTEFDFELHSSYKSIVDLIAIETSVNTDIASVGSRYAKWISGNSSFSSWMLKEMLVWAGLNYELCKYELKSIIVQIL